MVGRGQGRLTLTSVGVLALLVVVVTTSVPICHAHHSSDDSLYDGACPDCRLATNAVGAGPVSRPSNADRLELPARERIVDWVTTFASNAQVDPSSARAPPLPA
jgi:hypothetical protein